MEAIPATHACTRHLSYHGALTPSAAESPPAYFAAQAHIAHRNAQSILLNGRPWSADNRQAGS